MFQGSLVALVTPFKSDGSVDEERLRELVDWHIQSGTNGIVPCGTTGEAATLSVEEHENVVRIVVEQVDKRIPVIAGAGSNNTAAAVELTQKMKKLNVDGVLSVTPYYNKPNDEGLFKHFQAIDEVGVPMVVYNVPGRTGKNMTAGFTLRLARELNNVVAVKEASGDLEQVMNILNGAPDEFHVLSGEDALTFPMITLGVKGCISVVANEMPQEFSQMIDFALNNNLEEAKKIHYRLLDLMQANFVATNPVPVKTALWLMKKIDLNFRLPLAPMRNNDMEIVRCAIQDLGLF